jgi:hypothetical protein
MKPHSGKVGAADQSVKYMEEWDYKQHAKAENSTMNNLSIESSGGEKISIWVEENCVFTETFLYICNIIIYLVRPIKICLNETYSKVRIAKHFSDKFPIQR